MKSIIIKYLSLEAIENCITCLNYEIDKVIFFGYKEVIKEEKRNISRFLNEKCNTSCEYINIDDKDLKQLISVICGFLNKKDGCFYFDMTGCEGLCQIAFTNVAYLLGVPMHLYDVRNDTVFNIDDEIKGSINDLVRRKININIDDYIKMVGGCVRYDKVLKFDELPGKAQLETIANIKQKHEGIWICFTTFIQSNRRFIKGLRFECNDIREALDKIKMAINIQDLLGILKECEDAKLIKNFRQYKMQLGFSFADEKIYKAMNEQGFVLEQEVYLREKTDADDCMIGVYLDWDGVVQQYEIGDVYNEIDVLVLKKYILTFISCKNTQRIKNDFLYELETVTRRFGGNYAKMKLATTAHVGENDRNRAALIGIEIETYPHS